MTIERPPALDQELVLEFVKAGHGNLERVKEMLNEEPGLLNACWDWGGGDWETALGGAAHMGSKEIAEYLLANGARIDLFCAAMLGKKDLIAAAIADDPRVIHAKGAHGISLIAHAKIGEQDDIVALIEAQM